jgi:C1A family cysteine protease
MWQLYHGGVIKNGLFQCKSSPLDHGVQLVGYDDTKWIVRNSWGASWGVKGFV